MKKLIGFAAIVGGLVYAFKRLGAAGRGKLRGQVERLATVGRNGAANDETLTQRVRSELFRDLDVPSGQVNVNAQDGVVQLRGEVPNEDLIGDLVARARAVHGVREVENLLHTPGQPAPMHQ